MANYRHIRNRGVSGNLSMALGSGFTALRSTVGGADIGASPLKSFANGPIANMMCGATDRLEKAIRQLRDKPIPYTK